MERRGPATTQRRVGRSQALLAACSIALALLASACGGPETKPLPPSTPKPQAEVKNPAEPRLTLKGEAVLLDGEQAGDVSAAVQAGRATKIDALFDRLKQHREAFLAANPGAPVQGRCRIELDAQTPDPAWRSVVITAYFANYTTMALVSGDKQAELRASIPLPPERGGPVKPIMLTMRNDKVEVQWLSADGRGKRVEAPRPGASADGSYNFAELSAGLQKECGAVKGPCFDVVELRTLAPLSFGELIAATGVIKPFWGGAEPMPVFDFMRGTSLAGSPEEAGGAGVLQGSGRVDTSEVKRIVRANFDKFLACYQQGLKRDPKLAGRVVVQFLIDPNGRVSEARSVKTDSKGQGGVPAGVVTTMPDERVVGCVLDAYRGITFPKPQGGPAVVVFPVELGTTTP